MSDPLKGAQLPVLSSRYQAPKHFSKSPVTSGITLHSAFSKYANREWVAPEFYHVCVAVEEALAELDVVEVHSEVPLRRGKLCGVVDLYGQLKSGRPVVAEIKSTLGQYALDPRETEIFQLASYAYLLDHTDPLLICIRVALRDQRINVFEVENPGHWVEHVKTQLAAA